MNHIQKVIIGVTEEELKQAAMSIVKAMDDEAGTDDEHADSVIIEHATQAWLEIIVNEVVAEAAWWALDGRSIWRAAFRECLDRQQNRQKARP